MKRLRTTTALVAALAALTPTLVPAQGLTDPAANAEAGCIAQKLAEGMAEAEAQTACAAPVAPEAVTPEAIPEAVPEAAPEAPAPDAPADMPAETPADQPSEQPAEAPAEVPTEQPAEQPAETPAEQPAEQPAETPAEVPVEQPAEQPAEAPAEVPAELPAEQPAETPAEVPAEQPVEQPAEAPVEIPAEQPAEQPAETPAEVPAEQPADQPAEAPVEIPAEQPSPDATGAQSPEASAEQPAAEAPAQAEAEAAPEAQQTLEAAAEAQQSAETGAPVANQALAAPEPVPADVPADGATAAAEQPAMQEEVITEDNARSSAQDFATTVTAQPTAEDKGGLSTKEKLAILGLGAIAVGAMLNNGSEVAVNSGDRVVLQNPDGSYQVIKDDNALLRQPGSTMRTQSFADGSTRTIATKADGAQIVTVYDAQRRIVQRTRIEPDGTRYVLIDDAAGAAPIDVSTLPRAATRAPEIDATDAEALRAALEATVTPERRFTLAQVRQIASVRELAPAISVETITFATGSSAIRPEQARALATLGDAIRAAIAKNPREVFLIEGHTDAVGNAAYNLALSDRRAESLALALSEYFDVPAENMVVQGYGEQYLRVDTQAASEANRRASVRRITDLLQVAAN